MIKWVRKQNTVHLHPQVFNTNNFVCYKDSINAFIYSLSYQATINSFEYIPILIYTIVYHNLLFLSLV